MNSELLRNILDIIPDGLLILDERGSPLFINQAAEPIFRNKKPAVPFYEMLLQTLSFDPLSFNKFGEREVLIHKSLYFVSVHPLNAVQGKKAVVLFLRNSSLLKEADDIKTDFISIASHELRNPLTSLKSALEILGNKGAGEITPVQDNFLKIALRNANRVFTLVNQYLDLSKLTLDKLPFEFKKHSLEPIAFGIVEEFKRRAEHKNISIAMEIPAQLPDILADASKLEQILVNLIDNALKYSFEGDSITISARHITVQFAGGYDQSMIEVSVADTGAGIPEDKREQVFEKFFRLDRSTEAKQEGMGLGLALVKKLVERQGGEIRVEANQPAGSRFCFTIPAYEGERRDPNLRLVLDREVQQARKNQCALSLIAIAVDNFISIQQQNGDANAQSMLDELENSIKNSVYRQADVFVSHKKGEILVVICETERKGAEIVCSRIEKNLHELEERLKRNIQFHCGIATYPDEAENQRELFKKALAQARGEEYEQ
jgi:diguanylate cyclase (GGDEF)-like protein